MNLEFIYGMQLLLSPIWLRYFEFGPFEWIWRRLAYGKRPPFFRSQRNNTPNASSA